MLTTALAFGFLGSLHCAFMCGPLAVAGCARGRVGYFAGRAIAYTFVGAVFGSVGAHAQHLVPAEWILGAVAAFALYKGIRLLVQRPQLVQLRRPSLFERVVPRRGPSLGVATGFLPCGLLAGAWALAAASGDPIHGAAVMAVFSLATLPALLASVLLSGRLRWRPSPAVAGLLWCALAVWVGVRPLFLVHGCH